MSSTWLLGLAWGAMVVAVAFRWRPGPARVRALLEAATDAGVPPSAGWSGRAPGLVERTGGWALRRVRRRGPYAREAARRTGWAVVAALAFLPVLPAAAVPAALLVWALPGARARRADRRRLAAIARDLPDVVDLLVLGVGAGLTPQLAVGQVAARAGGPLARELAVVVDDVALGRRFSDALEELPARAGEAVRPLVGALLASERYGAPLVAGLERLSDEVRRDRRRSAEEAARKIPVKLLFPLVTCTLPAFGLLTVAPLIASAVRSLRL
jgi:hypothetical protein